MRLPRHDTPLSLSAEPPAAAVRADEALLDQIQPGQPPLWRWYTVTRPALVIGLGLRARAHHLLYAASGIEVVERHAGGGLVLLDAHMLCCAVCVALPDERVGSDLTASYRWIGERFATGLRALGLRDARRCEVDEARASVAALKARADDPVAQALLTACYGALSPHEVVVGSRKIVGLAQVRRRHAALFQIGVLLRDQSRLADHLRLDVETPVREAVRAALRERTIGIEDVLQAPFDPAALIAAI